MVWDYRHLGRLNPAPAPTALRRVVCFGHSHMGAMVEAFKQQKDPAFGLDSFQFLHHERQHIVNIDGKWCYNPVCVEGVRTLLESKQTDLVMILLQGEQAVIAGLSQPARPFDFYFPGEEDYRPQQDYEVVPYDMLFQWARDQYMIMSEFLAIIRPHIKAPVFALSPPPLMGDAEFILQNVNHREIADRINGSGLAPKHWRQRIWALNIVALRAIYAEHGVGFVEPPSASYGEDGFLLPQYRSDVFHANQSYGDLLLDQIRQLLDAGRG